MFATRTNRDITPPFKVSSSSSSIFVRPMAKRYYLIVALGVYLPSRSLVNTKGALEGLGDPGSLYRKSVKLGGYCLVTKQGTN